MEIQLERMGETQNVNIINAYTPDMRYGEETHNRHWGETREIMRQIPKSDVI